MGAVLVPYLLEKGYAVTVLDLMIYVEKVLLYIYSLKEPKIELLLEGSSRIDGRIDGKMLTIWDDIGRVLCIELEFGKLLQNCRI